MRARDRDAVGLYRTTLSAIANAEAVPIDVVPRAGAVEASALGLGAADRVRRELTEDMVRGVVEDEIAERRAGAELPGVPAATRDRLSLDADLLADLLVD